MNGMIGKKVGMTHIFDASGRMVPVTVLEVGPCVVTEVKTVDSHGYAAVQLGYGDSKEKSLGLPQHGFFKKSGIAPKCHLREFRTDAAAETKVGEVVTAATFSGVSYVDVVGTSKGRGFQGVVRRHGMKGGRASHGSGFHRRVGSIGQKERPGRVWPGKRMAGHMGNVRVTTQNLRVVQVREEDNVLLLEGAVPGPVGGIVLVNKSIKKSG